ncbi:class I mannose-6-phosphate isomerase [Mycolicibacterium goodii]|uniref:Class I mannose-6-phosphate isomerase n=1 Tax=Mycolicibacterium goodii TaxID=134601 RepID=A0ABS6HU88_MYCGD|nr:class I mannose-6-phosphate isomerase [Mycolicibacterium goodii]MBU8825475.1 class I mannose-6-phosphate isomerase [Mycolicibacterium goodii]MBU8838621.1 class I mannose-6-phosphate isomerase [Mycolicibacterium goodii]
MTQVRPQLLPPNVIEHWYAGGPALAVWRGLPPVGQRCPEEWVGATVGRFGEPDRGPATLSDGTLLRDAVRADPAAWLGRTDGAAGDTGVLVKLIDAGQRLPVHVHPTRDFAVRHLDCVYGKTEAWYVLEARDDAAVWVGWRADVDPGRIRALVASQDAEAMLALMNRIPVRPGDGVLVPGGTAHAIGAGVLVVEAQEPTDQSILLERTNTTASDDEVFLGLACEVALGALDSRALSDPSTVLRHADGSGLFAVLPPEADPYFRMEILTAGGRVPAGFAVAVVLTGRGVLRGADSALEVAAGNTLVVPAASGDWQVDGEARLLVCRAGTTWPPTTGGDA